MRPSGNNNPKITADESFQARILPGVSRTFALTIPELPQCLRYTVTNAYLLCRIADTIEDEAALTRDQKLAFHARFSDAVRGRCDGEALARELIPLLSAHTLEAEKQLVRDSARVLAVTRSLAPAHRAPVEQCIDIMCRGMGHFEEGAQRRGVASISDLERYCYYVAGVVGEMLTELFCAVDPEIAAQRECLLPLAVSFGQGLQMTNILKDVWDDHARGYCWLPREIFDPLGVDLQRKQPHVNVAAFSKGMSQLVGIAHEHLKCALQYTLMIPPAQTGIRHFCLWAIGMAVLTLKNIAANPGFDSGMAVKISRRSVKLTIAATNLTTRSNALLKPLFALLSHGLPESRTTSTPSLPRAAVQSEWELQTGRG